MDITNSNNENPKIKKSLSTAKVNWQKKTPHSIEFDDIYFSPDDGLGESQYVFLAGNQLEQRWQNLKADQCFSIMETGFGTGLNFLNTCLLWNKITEKNKAKKQNDSANTFLDYIAFEKFPLSLTDLRTSLEHFPELKELSHALLAAYPKPIKSLHRIHLAHNIRLTLCFDDALAASTQINTTVDALFLDGFSPSANPELWSEELFESLSHFLKNNTTFSTFTAAGHVRRKLMSIGFTVDKIKGYGNKREMLIGKVVDAIDKPKNMAIKRLPYTAQPWLYKTPQSEQKPQQQAQQQTEQQLGVNHPDPCIKKNISIIGGGLAGAWTAYSFAQRGWQVDLFEQDKELASGASGNPRGATYLKPSLIDNRFNDFYLNAYLYSIRQYQGLFPDEPDIWDPCGLIQLSTTPKLQETHKTLSTHPHYSQLCSIQSNEELSALAGLKLDKHGIFFQDAGSIDPKKLCEKLTKHRHINVKLGYQLESLDYQKETKLKTKLWQLNLKHEGEDIKHLSPYVVLANSYFAAGIPQSHSLPLNSIRGQTSHLKANENTQKLKTIICADGYLTPAQNNMHCLGSTFDPRNNSSEVLEEDNETNLSYLKKNIPSFYENLFDQNKANKPPQASVVGAKAALRCQSPDNLPILGQAPDRDSFIKDYADIAKGQLKKDYPLGSYHPGLYVNLAHGSRGLISTPFCAELLCDELENTVLGCTRDLYQALSPARFYIRDIRKTKIPN